MKQKMTGSELKNNPNNIKCVKNRLKKKKKKRIKKMMPWEVFLDYNSCLVSHLTKLYEIIKGQNVCVNPHWQLNESTKKFGRAEKDTNKWQSCSQKTTALLNHYTIFKEQTCTFCSYIFIQSCEFNKIGIPH